VTFFDGHLRAGSLRSADLADLAFFGVVGALVAANDESAASAPAIARAWTALVGVEARRLRRAGLAGYAALGIHPRRIPRRGLEALLADLPDHLGRRGVVALGAIGLESGGDAEEAVFVRQLDLARELRLPVLVTTPWRDKERVTRRTIAVLRESQLDPLRVRIDQADARTVRMIRACGYSAGLSLSGGGGRGDPIDEAVRLVRSMGPEGIVLCSATGEGPGDLLALPRAAARMSKAQLSNAVIGRVCRDNALALIGLDRRALSENGRAASGRSGRPSSR
jgi:hypothetical protein